MIDGTDFDEDPFLSGQNKLPAGETTTANLSLVADALRAKQEAFVRVADTLYSLWRQLPEISTRQADGMVRLAHQQLLDLAPALGVSRSGIPELRECCGKKRVWPANLLVDPSKTLDHVVVPIGTFEELGWWPGDIIRRITKFFGAAYCEKCDRRRRAINRFFGKRD